MAHVALALLLFLTACASGAAGPGGRPDPCELVINVWGKVYCPNSNVHD